MHIFHTSGYYTINRGSTGSGVIALQHDLNFAGYEVLVDGIFGQQTEAQVRKFQHKQDLLIDGFVNYTTRKALMQVNNIEDNRILRRGSRGSEVIALQTDLKLAGCYSGEIDGIYGEATEQSVIDFQKEYKLSKSDGVMDEFTRFTLQSVNGVDSADTTLKLNSFGYSVMQVQQDLIAIGYEVRADGIFGPRTLKGVSAFQAAMKLKVDGIVGLETERALADANGVGRDIEIRKMPCGSVVIQIQQDLVGAHYDCDVDGLFGYQTIKALKQFQREHNLYSDGNVGTRTRAALAAANGAAHIRQWARGDDAGIKMSKAQKVFGLQRPVHRSSGSAVHDLQADLLAIGYLNIQERFIPGQVGHYTAQAVQRFQALIGHTADGVIDNVTRAALSRAVGVFPILSSSASSGPNSIGIDNIITSPRSPSGFGDIRRSPSAASLVSAYAVSKEQLSNHGVTASSGDLSIATADIIGSSYMSHPSLYLSMSPSGSAVISLQQDLSCAGFYSGGFDGVFGFNTKNAVIAFQRVSNLVVDGIAGAKTRAALRKANGVGPDGELRIRSTGSAVMSLQLDLRCAGHECLGNIDGSFGRATTASVKAFQKEQQMKADGLASPETLRTLDMVNNVGMGGTLRLRSYGSHVLALQQDLFATKFFSGIIDGLFGPDSFEAVRAFQTAKNLPVTGVADSVTLRALAAANGVREDGTIQQGPSGAVIIDLQRDLNHAGFYNGKLDGWFGHYTDTAVRNFQRAHGLVDDGVVGPLTIARLKSVLGIGPDDSVTRGSRGSIVNKIQQDLVGAHIHSIDAPSVDGNFGPRTEAAVRQFQLEKGLRIDGIVGPTTRAALAVANGRGNGELHQGLTGSAIIQLQHDLLHAGYDPGKIDGIFSHRTAAAVRRFQKEHSLIAEGIVDPQTRDALDEANGVKKKDRSVRLGSKGSRVIQLQHDLYHAGCDPGPINGIFGEPTDAALKDFQTKAGLSANGIANEAVLNALAEANGIDDHVFISLGPSGATVKILQYNLKAAGYDVDIDGCFSAKTDNALREFQKSQNLKVDGKLNLETMLALRRACNITEGGRIKIGSRGAAVLEAQFDLKCIGLYDGDVNGIFDEKMDSCVKSFQDFENVPATRGVVGERTREFLLRANGIHDGRLLRGPTGSRVISLQQDLVAAGYLSKFNSIVEVDGVFDRSADLAVKHFQSKQHNLTVNGIVDQATLTALSATNFNGFRHLQLGAVGSAVVKLQQDLYVLQAFSDAVDGIFDQRTAEAVQKFQTVHNIEPTGVVCLKTQMALLHATCVESDGTLVIPRSKGSAVMALQQDLLGAGLYQGPITGFFNMETEMAINELMKSNEISNPTITLSDSLTVCSPDGIPTSTLLSQQTMVLDDSFSDEASTTGTSSDSNGNNTNSHDNAPMFITLPCIPRSVLDELAVSNGTDLKEGFRQQPSGHALVWLQEDLKSAGFYDAPVDGFFGLKTQAAVKRLQLEFGLKPDGVVGPKTFAALADANGVGWRQL